MKKVLIAAGFLLASQMASAALPPYWESMRQLKEILASPKVAEVMTAARPIHAIVQTDDGYEIQTIGSCSLQVKVTHIPLPGGMVGPGKIDLEVADALVCP